MSVVQLVSCKATVRSVMYCDQNSNKTFVVNFFKSPVNHRHFDNLRFRCEDNDGNFQSWLQHLLSTFFTQARYYDSACTWGLG